MKFIQIKILLIDNARERDYTFVINEGFSLLFTVLCVVGDSELLLYAAQQKIIISANNSRFLFFS